MRGIFTAKILFTCKLYPKKMLISIIWLCYNYKEEIEVYISIIKKGVKQTGDDRLLRISQRQVICRKQKFAKVERRFIL